MYAARGRSRVEVHKRGTENRVKLAVHIDLPTEMVGQIELVQAIKILERHGLGPALILLSRLAGSKKGKRWLTHPSQKKQLSELSKAFATLIDARNVDEATNDLVALKIAESALALATLQSNGTGRDV